jgi:hypothetical protein
MLIISGLRAQKYRCYAIPRTEDLSGDFLSDRGKSDLGGKICGLGGRSGFQPVLGSQFGADFLAGCIQVRDALLPAHGVEAAA